MRLRLVLILTLLVLAPLVTLAWLGARFAESERQSTEQRFRELAEAQLEGVAATVNGVLASRARALQDLPAMGGMSPDAIRRQSRTLPWVKQLFVLAPDGSLQHPDPAGVLSAQEREFLARTEDVFARGEIGNVPVPEDGRRRVTAPQGGWVTWYWGPGMQTMYWWQSEDGSIAGAELNRARLMSDVLNALPESSENSDSDTGYALVDPSGTTLYRWGGFVPDGGQTALASVPLSAPLSAWSLEYHMNTAGLTGSGAGFGLASGLGALAIALIGLAVVLYRERVRESVEAQQRVTFVNQVSHELKTPLTNIRMYADLLEEELADDESERKQKYLKVITSESQRLSRLIGNVLTFGRSERKGLQLHPTTVTPDMVVEGVLDSFRPALDNRGIVIDFVRGASDPMRLDSDVLEQILGNLLSNVEKYAKGADRVRIKTSATAEQFWMDVADNGPGIPKSEQTRVFEPFYRVSNTLTDGVVGTGIGLSICRDLARFHGGDIELLPDDTGTRFHVVLKCVPEGTA